MAELNRVVAWDPSGEYWEGSLVAAGAEGAMRLRGAVLLPVDPELFRMSGIGGYFRRSWGAGWPLDHLAPRSCCPATLFVPALHRTLHWRLRLVPDAAWAVAASKGERFTQGQLTVAADVSRAGGHRAGVTPSRSPYQADELGKTDGHGGWTVEGHAILHPPADSYYEFSVYGTMPGVRAAWFAVSSTL